MPLQYIKTEWVTHSTHGPIETTPVVSNEGERRWCEHNTIHKNTNNKSAETFSLQTEFEIHNIIQVCLPFIQSLINMESATTIYKNGNELHTRPTSVQFHTLQSYAPGSSTFHPSASSRTNLAQHGQKSTCAGPEIIFSNKTLSILILSKTYPSNGYT